MKSKAHNLKDLLYGIKDAPPIKYNNICDDSRYVNKGTVFFAVKGLSSDGCDFIESAINSGACAVVYEPPYDLSNIETSIPIIAVDDLKLEIANIVSRHYESSINEMSIIGVTGTNGKTTVSWLIHQGFKKIGYKSGYIGTLGYGLENLNLNELTTPSCMKLHKILSEFQNSGVEYVVMEISSHAIDQKRIEGINFNTVIFTNLSRDHIDYHGNMENYGETKAKLFLERQSKIKIININDSFGRSLIERVDEEVISTSIEPINIDKDKFISVTKYETNGSGFDIDLKSSWGTFKTHVPLLGTFNIENVIQTIALFLSHGFSMSKIQTIIEGMKAPSGRMESVDMDNNHLLPKVLVDFSHTPDALKLSLQSIRDHYDGKIWCVFGCGGDRDRGKRKMMGNIAERYADYVIVTSDNPRNENPEKIISDILEGISSKVETIVSREEAINFAIMNANKNEIILIAGKGHESYQKIGEETLEFSDHKISKKSLIRRSRDIAND
jgi:UDP-N-acetylmuramoyl-L-alanyl-D-glutamate--2,6-diaminopimelate ligase